MKCTTLNYFTQCLQDNIVTNNIIPQISNTRNCSCVAKQAFGIQCFNKRNGFVNSKILLPIHNKIFPAISSSFSGKRTLTLSQLEKVVQLLEMTKWRWNMCMLLVLVKWTYTALYLKGSCNC